MVVFTVLLQMVLIYYFFKEIYCTKKFSEIHMVTKLFL